MLLSGRTLLINFFQIQLIGPFHLQPFPHSPKMTSHILNEDKQQQEVAQFLSINLLNYTFLLIE